MDSNLLVILDSIKLASKSENENLLINSSFNSSITSWKLLKTGFGFSLFKLTPVKQGAITEEFIGNYKSSDSGILKIRYLSSPELQKEYPIFELFKELVNKLNKGGKTSIDDRNPFSDLDEIAVKKSSIIEIKPNALQQEVLMAIEQYRNTGKKSGLCIIPTGCGKTYLGALETKVFTEGNVHKNKIVFVSHLRNVITQTHRTFSSIFGEENVGYYTSELGKDIDKPIIIASAKSLSNALSTFPKDFFDYVIIDEFHHAIAEQFASIIRYFDYKFLLGLTATPSRTDNQDVTELVEGIIYETQLTDVLEKYPEILAYPDYYLINTNLNFSDEFENGSFNVAKISRKMIIPSLDKLVLREIKEKVKSKKTLIFCPSVLYAKHITKLLHSSGYTAGFVGIEQENQMTSKKIFDEIKKFKDGTFQFLVSVDMLNEGFDVPDCEALIFLRPTDSERIWLQQLGRGLRRTEGKDTVLVLDFVGVANNFSNLEQKVNTIAKLNNLFNSRKPSSKVKSSSDSEKEVSINKKLVNKIDESILEFIANKKREKQEKIELREEKIQDNLDRVNDITDTILNFRNKLGRIGLYSIIPVQTKKEILYTLFYMKYTNKSNLEVLNLDRLTLAYGLESKGFIGILNQLFHDDLKDVTKNYKVIRCIEYIITYGGSDSLETLKRKINEIMLTGGVEILEELRKKGEEPYKKYRQLAFGDFNGRNKDEITRELSNLKMAEGVITSNQNLFDRFGLVDLDKNDVAILYAIPKERIEDNLKNLSDKHLKICFLINKNIFTRKKAFEYIKDSKFKEAVSKDKMYSTVLNLKVK